MFEWFWSSDMMNKSIIIDSNGSQEDKLFRVVKRTNLIIKPGPRCLSRDIVIKTNYPIKKGAKFVRNQYSDLPISADRQDLICSSFNWQCSIQLDLAGTFHFQCISANTNWSAYVIVDPELKVPINQIKCQTVLSKNLGPFKEWRKRLDVARSLKYNMIHFTPVQKLGASNSAYALADQHKVNPMFKATLDDIKKEVDFMEKKWSTLSVTDIVLNHTADDCQWVREHPECSYNMTNSPHLRPAFLIDSAFIWIAKDIISGALEATDGLTALIYSEEEIQIIKVLLSTFYIPQLKIHELFMINIPDAINNFKKLQRGQTLKVHYTYERNNAQILTIPQNINGPDELRALLESENLRKRNEFRSIVEEAVQNALSAVRYERLDPNGPYFGKPICEEMPLVAPYFSHSSLKEFKVATEENLMYTSGHVFMAHNGWIMGATTTEDFASAESQVFIRRQLVAWGDCIKLRYGSSPKDVPYLWEYMRKYVESQAKVFHGLRIDNCHSTPMHVAEYMIDAARAIRPDIYVMAELFTCSEATDNTFVNRLGITSLIRESMSAHDARELGRLLYRFGGTPVGAFYHHGTELLRPTVAHAIFYDQTHDNDSPIVKRSAFDVPATASLINMANCATGSNRGYDELVPHHINVVKENRLYPLEVPEDFGIFSLRRMLNGPLQRELVQGFEETFVDQVNEDVIAITRHNPIDGRSIVLIARTAFTKQPSGCHIRPIPIQGTFTRILFEAQAYGNPKKYTRDESFINGLPSFKTKIFTTNVLPADSKIAKFVQKDEENGEIELNEFQFLPSSVIAIEISLSQRQTNALKLLNAWQVEPEKFNLNLNDANYILFRCSNEDGLEPYDLPNFCKFTYSGLYGLMYYLEKVRDNQDQAHPLAMNLRSGSWLSEYIVSRLQARSSTQPLAVHLDIALKQVDLLPRGMVPKYFDLIITRLYNSLLEMIYSNMSVFVSKGPRLVKLLALSSVALIGQCESAPMPSIDLSKIAYVPSIAAGLPHFSSGYLRNWGRDTFIAIRGLLLITGRFNEAKAIILSYARTLKHGLIPNLLDGGSRSRYNCRDSIWWWLYSIREYTKLAPNGNEILRCMVKRLHKPEISPAANATIVANGNTKQRKRSTVTQTNGTSEIHLQSLCDIIQEAMECHFRGVKFVEENAGKQLDEHMDDKGFVVSYSVDRETGFVVGGNRYNCGTWMDKMGSSEKAGTKGLPASPRDGAAVEIVGLCKAVVSWLDESFRNNRQYPYDGVESLYDNTITLKWTWKKWASMIQANFEKYFYIPTSPDKTRAESEKLINRRGIYKDTVGATLEWQDYQLRPNFLVAMVVAPELFDKEHAKNALSQAKEHLSGPLGMKTLDPSDWNYCGDYDNGNDTTDAKVAHGYNYHQGPEWLWLTGYYIRASSKFLGATDRDRHLEIISNFFSTLIETPWLGLPELTNTDGKFCRDSCPIQAWSVGTALEALHESARV